MEETESSEPRAQRPPLRTVLVSLIAIAGWPVALIALDKATSDAVAVVVALLGYGGYIAWYFWSHRYQ
jgi:hypothetical protein